jgi:hypothetical protein
LAGAVDPLDQERAFVGEREADVDAFAGDRRGTRLAVFALDRRKVEPDVELGSEGIKSVEMRTSSRIDDNIPTRITKYSQGGTTELPHPAFAAQGGGQIALDPNDKEGTHALRPQFHVWLDLPPVEGKDGKPRPAAVPGERVYVRFTLANKRPLLIQWVHRARQVVRDRLGV